MKDIKYRVFYDWQYYPVIELSFSDGFVSVGIEMFLEGLGKRRVSCDSDRVKAIEQFTCFKDKNGKEIYEGDILRLSYGDVSHHRIFWDEKSARWMDERLEDGDSATCYDEFHFVTDCKVIGNIYQNPELLGK